MDTPLPPRRRPQSELNALAQTQAQPAAPVQPTGLRSEGSMDMLGGLGDEIGKFLEGLFGKAFGGTPSYPGYQWDALEGWVPDQKPPAAAPAAPAVATPEGWHAPMAAPVETPQGWHPPMAAPKGQP